MGVFRSGYGQRAGSQLNIPAKLAINTQPSSSATSGVALSTQPVIQLTDGNGNPLNIAGRSVLASVISGTGVLTGTTSVNTNASGRAIFTNLVLTGASTDTLQFIGTGLTPVNSNSITVGTSGGTANLLNNTDFETNFSPWTDWSGGTPTDVTRDNSPGVAYHGSWAVRRDIAAGASTGHFTTPVDGFGTPQDRVYVRFGCKFNTGTDDVMKYFRAKAFDPIGNYGGLFLCEGNDPVVGYLNWGWDWEDGAIFTSIGSLSTQTYLQDGNQHYIEFDYWRNGDPSGFPSVGFKIDGVACKWPPGTAHIHFSGAGNNSFWDSSGRLQAGERNPTTNGVGISWFENFSILNSGNTRVGSMWMDYVGIGNNGYLGA